jgi:hypothetical protein
LVECRRIKYSGNKAPIEIAGGASAWRAYHDLNKPQHDAMNLSAEALYQMSDLELLAAYVEARRQFVEKKFTRDTHRARLEWIKAKMFTSSAGGVTERNMAIDVSEEIARKGQELREMARDLDLLKVDPQISKTTPCKVAAGRHGCFESELTRRANHRHSFNIP